MEIETLKKSKKKQILIGGICAIAILSVGVLATSRAKYKLTESINIANGTVNYKVPDFQIVAMYKSEDGTNYTELEGRMPSSGYVINESKSYCNYNGEKDTNAVLKTVDDNHIISNIIKGDKCNIYFDKYIPTSEEILANLGIIPKNTTPDFNKTATTDDGVYKIEDGMYEGNSYYWRGSATNNYVKFANFCWRIVRINGDGSIRLIYDGTVCHANGTNTEESMTAISQVYNSDRSRNEYLGWTYSENMQRPLNNESGTASNAKEITDNWYSNNIGNNPKYNAKVATGKFCNDRELESGTWASTGTSFYYAARGRLETNKKPTLDCHNENDIYKLKAGAITADEVAFAGGKWNTANTAYYLYNGQYYWTMSPLGGGGVLSAQWNGSIGAPYANSTVPGIRPVINLNANVTFSSGNGSLDTPFIVAD